LERGDWSDECGGERSLSSESVESVESVESLESSERGAGFELKATILRHKTLSKRRQQKSNQKTTILRHKTLSKGENVKKRTILSHEG
jgi:hypothetical protein